MKIFDKKYRMWWIIGGGGLILLLLMMRGGSRSETSTQYVSGGPSEAAQIQMAQIGAGLQAQTNELRAMEYQASIARDVAYRELDTQMSLATIQATADSNTLNAQLSALQLQLGSQERITAVEADARKFEIDAYRDVTNTATTANYNMFVTQTQATSDMFAMQMQANMFGDQLQADMWNTAQMSQRDIELARITSSERVALDQGVTDRFALSSANKQNRSNNRTSLIGGIIGGALSLFSDVRAKDNIVQTGETADGIPLYEFDMNGSRRFGPMAQEVALYNPDLVRRDPSGYLVVDYSGIYQ